MGLLSTVGGNLLGPWRLYAEAAVVAGLVGWGGAQTWRLHASQAGEATAKAATALVAQQWALQVARGATAAAAASEKNRVLTAAYQHSKDEADHVLQTDHAASARTIAAFVAERAGVRSQIAAFAAGPADRGGLTVDTVPACRLRATALGSGLDGSLQAEEDLTSELELSRADTRSLLHAWPRQQPAVNP